MWKVASELSLYGQPLKANLHDRSWSRSKSCSSQCFAAQVGKAFESLCNIAELCGVSHDASPTIRRCCFMPSHINNSIEM